GANAAGILLGSLLLSLWAFAQPVLFYALLFGKPWLEGLEQLRIGSATIYWIVGALIGIKAICAGALVVLAYRLPESRIAALQAKLAGYRPAPSARKRSQTPARGALADLLHPFFLLSLALTASFFIFSNGGAGTALVWALLRPLALGYAIFFALRLVPPEKLGARLKRFPAFGRALAHAAERLQNV
ncbi:MAG: hypothetical protein ACXWPM_04930, partial [Bdellovibrionota bacterium]